MKEEKKTELEQLKEENEKLKRELELAELRAENARLRRKIFEYNYPYADKDYTLTYCAYKGDKSDF